MRSWEPAVVVLVAKDELGRVLTSRVPEQLPPIAVRSGPTPGVFTSMMRTTSGGSESSGWAPEVSIMTWYPASTSCARQRRQLPLEHRFAAGQENETGPQAFHLGQDLRAGPCPCRRKRRNALSQ